MVTIYCYLIEDRVDSNVNHNLSMSGILHHNLKLHSRGSKDY